MQSTEKIVEQFGNPELVPHEYIDSSLPKYKQGEQLDQLHSTASQLLSELDHHSQDLTLQLENLTGELLRASKKVSYEVELLKSDVAGLANDVEDAGSNKVSKLAHTDMSTVDRLNRLDLVKSRMQDVQKVFEQAKRFDEGKITEKIVGLLNSGKLQEARNEVESVAELCQVWKGTGLYQSRMKFVTSLRKRIDTTMNERKSEEDQQARINTPSAVPSRTGTPTQQQQQDQNYYGGFLGQFTRRMGY